VFFWWQTSSVLSKLNRFILKKEKYLTFDVNLRRTTKALIRHSKAGNNSAQGMIVCT